MLQKNISRKEFLKTAGMIMLAGFLMPVLKKVKFFKQELRQREARYYKELAG